VEYAFNGGPFAAITSGLYSLGEHAVSWLLPAGDGLLEVRTCVTDSAAATACDSETLSVDGKRPVAAVSPADGATWVAADAPILLTFNEPMRPLTADAFLFLDPGVGNLVGTWLDPQTFEVAHDPFDRGVTYTVRLGCGLTDAATPGNLLAGCPAVTTFTVEPPDLAPSVALLEPVDGARYVDATAVDLRWIAADDRDAVLAFTATWSNATSGGTMASGVGQTAAIWTVPADLLGPVTLLLCVSDSAANQACATADILLTSSPSPISQGQLPPGPFDLGQALAVTFPGTVAAADLGAALFSPAVGGIGFTWTYANGVTTLEIAHDDLLPCEDYTLTLTAPLGLPLWERSFRTLCGPAVAVDVEGGGGFLRGDSVVLVTWNLTDEDSASATLLLNYSLLGGSDNFPASVLRQDTPLGPGSLYWRVPDVDSLDLVLRLTAVDPEGHASWNVTPPLKVDATPPVPFVYREGDLVAGRLVTFDGTYSYDALSGLARHRWRVWTPTRGLLYQTLSSSFAYVFDEAGEYRVTLDVTDGAGNTASLTQAITVGNPSGIGGGITVEALATGSLLGLAALGAGAVATSEPVRNAAYRHLILPLYVRLNPDQVRNQETRGQVRGFITATPGSTLPFPSSSRTSVLSRTPTWPRRSMGSSRTWGRASSTRPRTRRNARCHFRRKARPPAERTTSTAVAERQRSSPPYASTARLAV